MLGQIIFIALMISTFSLAFSFNGNLVMMYVWRKSKLTAEFAEPLHPQNSINKLEKVYKLLRNDKKATEPHIQINRLVSFTYQEISNLGR